MVQLTLQGIMGKISVMYLWLSTSLNSTVYYLYVVNNARAKSVKAKMFKTLDTGKPKTIKIGESCHQKT